MAKRINRGDRLRGIPADDWNEFADVAEKVKRFPFPLAPTGAVSGTHALSFEVINKTGSDLSSRFPILKLNAPTHDTTDAADIVNEPIIFEGSTPDSTEIGLVAVVQGPLQNDDSLAAVWAGPTWVDVNITDAGHTHAQAIAGDSAKLQSGTSGARIQWKPAGTGVQRCVVLMNGGGGGTASGFLTFARVSTAISASTMSGSDIVPGTGQVKKFIRPGSAGANWVFDNNAVNAYNVYPDSFPLNCAVWVDHENYVVGAACTLLP